MLTIDLNLIFTLLAASVTAFLGMLVYSHERRSVSSNIFFIHTLVMTTWAVANYFSLTASPERALFWIRLVIFLAVPHVFLFFLFVVNFPASKLAIKRRLFILLLLLMAGMMWLTVSPFVFQSVTVSREGAVVPIVGSLMPIFAFLLVLLSVVTWILIVRKYTKAQGATRAQWRTIGIGLLIAYLLLIFFVFLRVVLFQDTRFVPYSPLFILPIFAGVAYAILRNRLFNIRVIATEVITFVLLVTSLIEVFLAETTATFVLSLSISLFILIFGILLIQSVLREVAQRTRLEFLSEELQAAYEKLKELDRVKSEFLSFASHQVKTPMTVIKGYASLLGEEGEGAISASAKETLTKVMRIADQTIALVNNLLNVRKIEEGRVEYIFEETDVNKIVSDVVEELSRLAAEKKLTLSFTPAREPCRAKIDLEKLREVVRNFVENAIKYTPQGWIKVNTACEEATKTILIRVADSGIGMPTDLIPKLFQEFRRDALTSRSIQGTGLGLYIAKQFITAHRGTVWAESEGPGKGSTFFIRIPAA
ncbi:MAG: hypothetical protein HY459_04560 [Parcubacteria group bacterium]|nr:hypothetical protein [Parcubacteria group bacterium]